MNKSQNGSFWTRISIVQWTIVQNYNEIVCWAKFAKKLREP